MSSITSITGYTELDAINEMLSAIGESPITNVDSATQADVALAINLLKGTTRALCAEKWRFNVEFGLEVEPEATTLSWTGNDGTSETLNVFLPPDGLASFELTPNRGMENLDVVIRKSKVYEVSGSKVLVFYDRALNRDGFVADDYPYLYITTTSYVDFLDMPDSARRYATIRAARQLAQRAVGSPDLSQFTERDEALAYRALVQDQKPNDRYTIFDSGDTLSALGGRPRRYGLLDTRTSTGYSG